MAARVGLVAVRDLGLEQFLAAFPMLEASNPEQSDGWTWASFNLLAQGGLVGPRAEQIARGLDRPALQAWTEDGALWYLAVYPRTRKLFRHVHWLRYNAVAAGREKVKKSVTLRRYIDQYEDGLAEDYKYAGPLPEGPIARAMTEHLRARASALNEALAACGARHDRAAVRDALTGSSVTDEEWSWDVGNLPRVLEAIGLGEAFPGWRDEIEEATQLAAEHKAAADAAKHAPPPDLVQPILDRLGDAEPTPIKGGPVVASPATLWHLPWGCLNDVELGLIVRPAIGQTGSRAIRPTPFKAPRGLEHLSVLEKDGAWRIGHPWVSVWTRAGLFEKLAPALAALPAGSTVELVSAAVDEPGDNETSPTAGNMRFRGVIERKRWKLTHATPPASAKDLKAALGIFDWIGAKGAYAMPSAAAARRVVETARASDAFGSETKDRPVASARGVNVRSKQWRPYLALHIFRDRFAEGPWDVRSGAEAEQESDEEFEKLLAAIGGKLNQAFAAPRGDDLVFQGQRSAFRSADIRAVKSKANLADLFRRLYPARDPGASLDLQEAVTRVDQAMVIEGLESMGDMVCEAFGEVVIRGYGRAAGDLYGLAYAGTTGQFLYEFNTSFSDGSSITTSIHHGQNRKEIKARHAQFPNASVEELLAHHVAAVEKHTVGAVKPEPHPLSLVTLAERIDDFLMRTAA